MARLTLLALLLLATPASANLIALDVARSVAVGIGLPYQPPTVTGAAEAGELVREYTFRYSTLRAAAAQASEVTADGVTFAGRVVVVGGADGYQPLTGASDSTLSITFKLEEPHIYRLTGEAYVEVEYGWDHAGLSVVLGDYALEVADIWRATVPLDTTGTLPAGVHTLAVAMWADGWAMEWPWQGRPQARLSFALGLVPVPEPGTALLVLVGLAPLLAARRP